MIEGRRLAAAFTIAIVPFLGPTIGLAQVSNKTSQPAVQPASSPITTQIKKTVVFLESDCVHDFKSNASNLTMDKLVQMPPTQQRAILNQITNWSLKLGSVEPSMKKLTREEAARMFSNPANIAPIAVPTEVEWKLQELSKMTTFTDEEASALTPQDLEALPLDRYRGTGFLVGYVDARLKSQAGEQGPRFFRYLVTNRHVIQPGIENGTPCKVVSSYILFNLKPDSSHANTHTERDRIDKLLKWVIPQDNSVDLAVAAIGYDEKRVDQMVIPTNQFVTEDDVKSRKIVEGDPLVFSGLFIQTFNQDHTLEPILRSGTLAMVPEGMLQTTLNKKLGHIYLADAHAFGGNSGSPVFIDPNKFAGVIGPPSYKLLGVISGEFTENSDLTFTVTTTVSGNLATNSDVSMIVPAPQLMELLEDTSLKADRDRAIKALSAPTADHQP